MDRDLNPGPSRQGVARLRMTRIRNVLMLVVAVIGVIVCIYSIAHHIELKTSGSTDFACNINDKFSCDAVVMTKYSELFGIPLGVFGLGFFLSMFLLSGLSWLTRDRSKRWIHTYAVMSLIGCGVSVIYGCISKFIIGAMCPSCMSIYTLCLIQFLVVVCCIKTIPKPTRFAGFVKDVFVGGIVCSVVVVCVVLGFLAFKQILNLEPINPAQALKEDIGEVMAFSDKIETIQINKKDNSYPTNDFRQGPDDSSVQMVIFSDFQCAGCAKLFRFIKQDLADIKDQILIVFKNFPVDSHCNPKVIRKYHEYACEAALMARCAGRSGKFWEYHDILFENRTSITSENLSLWAKQLGLNDMQIDRCKISKEISSAIQRDLVVADNLGVAGSPAIFVNGKRFIAQGQYNLLKLELKRLVENKASMVTESEGVENSSGSIQKENGKQEMKSESNMEKISRLIKTGKAVLLDVREDEEWNEGHFKQAVHIPLGDLQDPSKVKALPTNKVIYIHCRSGGRAQTASRILYMQGFEAYPLKMSYESVKEALDLTEER